MAAGRPSGKRGRPRSADDRPESVRPAARMKKSKNSGSAPSHGAIRGGKLRLETMSVSIR